MNDFVNYHNRSVQLPDGCKDLFDVLQLANHSENAASSPKSAPSTFKPELVSTRGLDHVERYVRRLSKSNASFRFLVITSLIHSKEVTLWYKSGSLKMILFFDTFEGARESAVRAFFVQANISPLHDEPSRDPKKATRMVEYPLPTEAPAVVNLITALFRQVYGISELEGLKFYYSDSSEV